MIRLLIICWLGLSLGVAQAAVLGQKTEGDCSPAIGINRGYITITCPRGLPKDLYKELFDKLDAIINQQQRPSTAHVQVIKDLG